MIIPQQILPQFNFFKKIKLLKFDVLAGRGGIDSLPGTSTAVAQVSPPSHTLE